MTDPTVTDPEMPAAAVIARTIPAVHPADPNSAEAARLEMEQKLKPPGSLGRLESLAARLAGIRGVVDPGVPTPAVVVCAADHGVAASGVSAFPQEVTGLMVDSFVAGGAAVCVLAREARARLVIADLGVLEPRPAHESVLDRRVRAGTANSLLGEAMTLAEAQTAVAHGIRIVADLVEEGVDLVALGEMGIGNTTTASAVTALMMGLPAAEVCGRGTGLNDEQYAHKTEVVTRIVARHASVQDPMAVLAAVGGLEIAGLVGVVLGCAAHRVPVVVDGFITGSAALIAAALAPDCVDAMIAGHRSVEPGHSIQLKSLALEPVLDLELRLGEGSGATLALVVLRSALAILSEMATFASIGH